jgi:hypothetical protein
MAIVWRKIVGVEFYSVRCKPGCGSFMFTLDCGHQVGKKASECKNKTIGSKIKCWECGTGNVHKPSGF